MISGLIFGIGYLPIFMAILNYLTDAYQVFAASANGIASTCRSVFGALLPLAARPMYTTLGIHWAGSLLAFISLGMAVIPFVFIGNGDRIRENSRFCQFLKEMNEKEAAEEKEDRRQSEMTVRQGGNEEGVQSTWNWSKLWEILLNRRSVGLFCIYVEWGIQCKSLLNPISTSQPAFLLLLQPHQGFLRTSRNQNPVLAPYPLQNQSPPFTSPRTIHLRQHPFICSKLLRIVKVDGVIQRHHHANVLLRALSSSCRLTCSMLLFFLPRDLLHIRPPPLSVRVGALKPAQRRLNV